MLSTMEHVFRERSARDDQTNKNKRDAAQCASSASGLPMTNLEYYLHDEVDALRIEIVGDLSGADEGNIEHAWRSTNSVLPGRHIVVGLMAAAEADDNGDAVSESTHAANFGWAESGLS
jgi:hypothetical protein